MTNTTCWLMGFIPNGPYLCNLFIWLLMRKGSTLPNDKKLCERMWSDALESFKHDLPLCKILLDIGAWRSYSQLCKLVASSTT